MKLAFQIFIHADEQLRKCLFHIFLQYRITKVVIYLELDPH